MRSKYGTYEVYHTSGDDLDFISAKGLQESLDFYIKLISEFEINRVPISKFFGEPMFSKYGLRKEIGGLQKLEPQSMLISNICAYADGTYDFRELSLILQIPVTEIKELCEKLIQLGLITVK